MAWEHLVRLELAPRRKEQRVWGLEPLGPELPTEAGPRRRALGEELLPPTEQALEQGRSVWEEVQPLPARRGREASSMESFWRRMGGQRAEPQERARQEPSAAGQLVERWAVALRQILEAAQAGAARTVGRRRAPRAVAEAELRRLRRTLQEWP